MKAHTSSFKENIAKFGRELDSKITYQQDGVMVELGDEELNSITPHYEGAILKSVMKQLDIDSNVEIPLGTILTYEFGLKIDDEYEYINFGNYVVYNVEKNEDTRSWKITCYDKMLYTMKDYENSGITYPLTVRDYINTICRKLGLVFKNQSDTFANYDKVINNELYLDSDGNSLGYKFRDVFDELAEVTASTICINEETDQLEIRYINDTADTIDEEYLKDINVKFGEKYGKINSIVLSRSAGSDNVYLRDEQSVAENGLCEIKIIDNQIMNFNDRSSYLSDILYRLGGLEYYINDFSSTGICYYNLCDKYYIQVDEKTYPCIMFNDEVDVTQGLEEMINTDMPEQTETDYSKADKTDLKFNQTYLIVDKQNGIIESVVRETTDPSNPDSTVNKVSRLTQRVGDLESQISDIADLTITGESSYAMVELDNINTSEPIMLKVRPITENISYLYPRNNLYPSDTLYPTNRKIRFRNKTTSENIDYEIPDDLLYYDSNTYDEFYLDYNTKTCQVTKRCGYNADGSVYALSSETINSYSYPLIELNDGDYEISLLNYPSGYLFARLMTKNIYTTQFYTRIETDSKIQQTAQNINLTVNQKLSNYSTTTEMNSAITLKANEINSTVSTKVGENEIISKINQTPETITINANKVNISGVLTAINDDTTTTINGNKITTGSITSSKVDSSVITTSNLSAQTISGNQINGGTITGTTISGNTISGGTISGTTISGSNIRSGDIKIGSRETTIASNGDVSIYPDAGGVFRFAQGAARINSQYGVAITSNGGSGIYASNNNLDLKACYGAKAYLACMSGNGSNERSAVECANGTLYLRSAGTIYANGQAIGGSSSKATKENIKNLTKGQKQELIKLIENIPLKQYDYKKEYGKKLNYGFLIEDIEETKLNDLLHITQSEINKDIKTYSNEDLTRLELVVIQELIKKNKELEERIQKLESESDK